MSAGEFDQELAALFQAHPGSKTVLEDNDTPFDWVPGLQLACDFDMVSVFSLLDTKESQVSNVKYLLFSQMPRTTLKIRYSITATDVNRNVDLCSLQGTLLIKESVWTPCTPNIHALELNLCEISSISTSMLYSSRVQMLW